MKTLFLAITLFWVLKSKNPKRIQSEDLFVKYHFILGTKIKKSEADLKERPFLDHFSAARKQIQLLNEAFDVKSLPNFDVGILRFDIVSNQ